MFFFVVLVSFSRSCSARFLSGMFPFLSCLRFWFPPRFLLTFLWVVFGWCSPFPLLRFVSVVRSLCLFLSVLSCVGVTLFCGSPVSFYPLDTCRQYMFPTLPTSWSHRWTLIAIKKCVFQWICGFAQFRHSQSPNLIRQSLGCVGCCYSVFFLGFFLLCVCPCFLWMKVAREKKKRSRK